MNARFNRTLALTLALALNAVPAVLASNHTAPVAVSTARPALDRDGALAAYGDLSLAYEANRGQADPSVRYTAHSTQGTLALTDDAALFATEGGTITMRFGTPESVTSSDLLPGMTNYLIGNDPAKWHTDVPSFGRITYNSVFPGVDLVFYGTNDLPEYDFVVAPGADPNAIDVEFDGVSAIHVDETGALVLATAGGDVRHERPFIYQETGGERVQVQGMYEIVGAHVKFTVAGYDRSKPLVIDPALKYATYVGGNSDDRVKGLAIDSSGNACIVGFTNSSNFPVAGQIANNLSGQDAFVTKLNSTGTGVVFSTYYGGGNTDNFNGVAIDSTGRIFAVGSSASNDAPTPNGYDTNPNGLDAILVVLNSSGSSVLYGTFIGGDNNDIGDAVAVDIHGNVYMAGETLETQGILGRFPTESPSSLDPFQDNYGGGRSDAFVTKFDPDETGNTSLVYSTLLGGSEGEGVEAITVDANERAYVCGYTESTNFPRLNAIRNTFGGGTEDGFITKFNADGTTVFYSTFFGGSAIDEALGIALDTSAGDNRPVVCGFTTSTNIPTQLPVQSSKNGPQDAWVCKLNDAGNQFIYSTYFGGPGNDAAQALTTDSLGNSYFTGFSNNAYPLVNPIPINGTTATTGATMTIFSTTGAVLRSTCIATGNGTGIAVDDVGDVYVAGTTSSTAFPVTPGAFQPNFGGAPNDVFALKFDMTNDDTVGVFKPGTRQFQLRNSNTGGPAELTATFGITGDKPIVGDWDGNGTTTIGVYTPSTGTFAIRNSNTNGTPDATFAFGAPNLIPISGDWDGDGDDTIGVFDPVTGAYFLKNSLAGGNADITLNFGPGGQGAIPVAGDWNGDGVDTIGFYVPSTRTFFLRNQNAGGNADLQFVFGPSAATPVAGDWNGDGIDTVATFSRISFLPQLQGMKFTFTNVNAAGTGEFTVAFGVSGDLAIVGNWDGQ